MELGIHLLPALSGSEVRIDEPWDGELDLMFCDECGLQFDSDGECRSAQCWCADCEQAYVFVCGERECQCVVDRQRARYWRFATDSGNRSDAHESD